MGVPGCVRHPVPGLRVELFSKVGCKCSLGALSWLSIVRHIELQLMSLHEFHEWERVLRFSVSTRSISTSIRVPLDRGVQRPKLLCIVPRH